MEQQAQQANALAGQVALVAGAGRGIGQAIAVQLARAGARVVIGARTSAQLQETIAPTASRFLRCSRGRCAAP